MVWIPPFGAWDGGDFSMWKDSHGPDMEMRKHRAARHQWLMPVILGTWEAEIRKIVFQASLGTYTS
jgi:hypothetical protein